MNWKSGLLLATGILLAGATATAQPAHLPLQGYLTDGTATPVDGTIPVTFRVYNAATGGSPMWVETFPSLLVEDGSFTVSLGTADPAEPLNLNMFNNGAELWVGIAIAGGAELTPRIALGTTPYAAYARSVPWSGITGVPATLADGDNDTTYTFQAPLRVTGGTTVGFSTTGCVAGEAWVWNGATWECTATTYSATNGIIAAGTTFSLDEPYVVQLITDNAYNTPAEIEAALGGAFQRPLTGAGECTGNSSLRAIRADGTYECQPGSSGTISGVAAGDGLTGGGVTGNVTLAVDPSYVQRRITGSCTNPGEFLVGIEADGDPVCAALPSSSFYTAGDGLLLNTTTNTFSVDTAYVQRRVGDCVGANDYIYGVNANGSPKCRTAQTIDVNAFADSNQSCPSGQVVYGFTSTGAALCRAAPSADTDTNTTYNGTCPTGQAVIGLTSAGGINCGSLPGDGNTVYNVDCGGGSGSLVRALYSNGSAACGRQSGSVYSTSCGWYTDGNLFWRNDEWLYYYCPANTYMNGMAYYNGGFWDPYYDENTFYAEVCDWWSCWWEWRNWSASRAYYDHGIAAAQLLCCSVGYN